MNDSVIKRIEAHKDVLSTLPKNNKKNIHKYQETIIELLDSYKKDSESIKEEILSRLGKFKDIHPSNKIDAYLEKINKIENNLYLLSDFNSSYEKVGLDRVLYAISKYYKSNLDVVNDNIYQCILIFQKVGVELSYKDFCYSYYIRDYMKVFFEHIDDYNCDVVRDTFSDIYWKCSDILMHLKVNFKFLYYKYKKHFDKYCDGKKKEFLVGKSKEDVWREYFLLRRGLDDAMREDIYSIVCRFKKKELNIQDYSVSKVDGYYSDILDGDVGDSAIQDCLNFYNSILEYKNYNEIKYILEDFRKIYSDKTNIKFESKNDLKEIQKIEGKLFKLNRKIDYLRGKNKDFDKYSIMTLDYIKSLDSLYDAFAFHLFKERVSKLEDSTTYYEVLDLVYSNYTYMVDCIKNQFEDITFDEIQKKIDFIGEILFNPYNTFMNHTTIMDDKDIRMVISDRYKLAGFKVSYDSFDSDMDGIMDKISKILVYHSIDESNISVDDIKLMCDSIIFGISEED